MALSVGLASRSPTWRYEMSACPYDVTLPPCRHEIAARRRWPSARWPRPAGRPLAGTIERLPVRRQRSRGRHEIAARRRWPRHVGLAQPVAHWRYRLERLPVRRQRSRHVGTKLLHVADGLDTLASPSRSTGGTLERLPVRRQRSRHFFTKLLHVADGPQHVGLAQPGSHLAERNRAPARTTPTLPPCRREIAATSPMAWSVGLARPGFHLAVRTERLPVRRHAPRGRHELLHVADGLEHVGLAQRQATWRNRSSACPYDANAPAMSARELLHVADGLEHVGLPSRSPTGGTNRAPARTTPTLPPFLYEIAARRRWP